MEVRLLFYFSPVAYFQSFTCVDICIYLSAYPSPFLSNYLFTYPSSLLSTYPFPFLSIYLPVHMPIYLRT